MTRLRAFTPFFAGIAVLSLLAGCGGSSPAPALPISVTVAPTTVTLIGGATETFTATVTNDSANAGVTWTASTGTISTSGLYTAPAVITTTSATITATSKTDTTKSATATVTLTPISVSVAPTTATLIASATQTFTATVTADGANAGVTWTATAGTITTAGVYTAPAVVTATSATITATSKTDPTKSASATVTLTPISVSVAPTTVTLIASATQTFTATVTADGANAGVTWTATAGTITTAGVYTAPAVVTATSATITATSKTDPTKSASATVTLTPISVSVAPTTVTLIGGATQTFTATVAADGANAGVTWTASTGTITTAGLYTAPAVVTTTSATITATSKTDPTKSASATVTLTPISVSVAPTTVTLIASATQTFTATVTADGANAGVTWTATAGTITTAGVYTAPAVVTTTSATITATSKTDTTKSATATVTLTPISISFTTATTGIVLDAGQTLALAAAVANDGSASGASFAASSGAGTVSPSSATGNAPATTLTAAGTAASTVTVTATSVKDPTKSASTAAITVNPALAITTAVGALAAATINNVYPGATIVSSGGTGAKTFAVATGSLPTGLTLGPTTGAITGTATGSAGVSTFTVSVTDSATTPVTVTSGTYTITVSAAPLLWVAPTTETLTYTVGTAIAPITLSTTGGTGAITYTVNTGSLPAGLVILGNQVTGIPTAPTVVTGNVVSFLATDSATPHVTATSANVTLIANPVTLAITTTTLAPGTVTVPYSDQLTSTGGTGAITWTMSPALVDGISLSSGGLLSGTPTTTNSSNVTITATDSATNQQQSKQITLPLTVTNALVVTSGTSFNAPVSSPFTTTLTAVGGSGTGYTWSVTAGSTSLAGLNLSLSTTGVLSGTPSAAGVANFTAQVKDSLGNTATSNITVTAYTVLGLPTPNPTSLGTATVNQSYTGAIDATGGLGPYTWTVNGTVLSTAGVPLALSDGLSVSNTGSGVLSVSGTPTATGPVTFTASVTDSTSAVAGPLSYTVTVSAGATVSGQIGLICSSSTSVPPTITVSINTSPVQTTTTDGSGNYSFSNILPGTYTVTPSITGPASVFYPATQSITVSGSPITANFQTNLGYTVAGTVTYSGTSTGQLYVALSNNSCGGNAMPGTSFPVGSINGGVDGTPGSFTIRGVPAGSYTLQAWLDNLGYGAQNAADPSGTASVTVSTSNVTGADVTVTTPAAVTLSSAPTLKGVSAFNTGALAQYKEIQNSNGEEMATSYTLQWSTTSSFTAIAGSKTFPATGSGTNIWFVNGLTNGSIYYFRAYGTSGGTAVSPYSSTVGPITINAPATGNTVSGAITYAGTATGPLYVGFYDQSSGNFYGDYIASPSSPQAYTVQVPTGSNYFFAAVLDQNKDGVLDAGDLNDIASNNNLPGIAITGNTTGENLTLSSANSAVTLTTSNILSTAGVVTNETYDLNFDVQGLVKLPVGVTLVSGPNVLLPMDIGYNANSGGSQFTIPLDTTSPNVGDAYGLQVTYSDSTSETLTATVSTVLTAFATNLSPTTGVSTSTAPTFSWTDPANAANYVYTFSLNGPTGTIWQIPESGSSSSGFASTITSIPWDTDPTGGGSTPNVLNLTTGTNYSWQIQVQDSNGNQAVQQVSYQP